MNIKPTMLNAAHTKMPMKITKFTMPGRTGTRVDFQITGELGNKVTRIKYQSGAIKREYKNKEGFPDERFAVIIENIQNVVKEGSDFLYEFLKAQKP